MPTYTFRNKDTDEETDMIMSVAQREEFLKDNPNMTQVLKPLGCRDNFIAGISGPKGDAVFRDILKDIKANNPGNRIEIL